MTQKEKLMVLLRLPNNNESSALLDILLDAAEADFCELTHRTDVPASAATLVETMALMRYNRLGAEGLSSRNISGIGEAYVDYPVELQRKIAHYRKMISL